MGGGLRSLPAPMRIRLLPDPAARRRRAVLAALCLAALVSGLAVGAGQGGDETPPQGPSAAATGSPGPSAAELSLREQIGQLVILRFDGTELPDYAADALRAGEASGAILFADNVVSEAQLRGVTRSIQRAAGRSALVATDQEGGLVRNVPFAPPKEAQTAVETAGEAARLARTSGRALRSLGINVNLAPVADVAGRGSALSTRVYPGGGKRVAELVAAAVHGQADGGTAAAAKHFPGLGAATANTDDASVDVVRGAAKLRSVDLEPFRAAIAENVPLVMASHARYPALDRGRVASQSPRILGGILRAELGFQGAVITDSLEAEAVLSRSSTPVAAVRSVAAGADLLLTTSSGSFPPVFERLLREARRSEPFRARVEEAAGRVLALKERLGLRAPASPPSG